MSLYRNIYYKRTTTHNEHNIEVLKPPELGFIFRVCKIVYQPIQLVFYRTELFGME